MINNSTVWTLISALMFLAGIGAAHLRIEYRKRQTKQWRRAEASKAVAQPNPKPHVGQRWRFGNEIGIVAKILPGGAGNLGIVEFAGNIPTAHVATMVRFTNAWKPEADAWQAAP